jgi:hypothetical protein
MSAVVGAALLASALVVAAPLVPVLTLHWPSLTADSVDYYVPPPGTRVVLALNPLQYLLAMGGLVALVATRSFRSAQRPGGGLQYAHSVALLITMFAGTGPVVTWLASIALNLPVVALIGSVLPGAWLAAVCAMALRRRTGPWPLAVVGTVAGLALIGALGTLPLTQVLGHQTLALLVGHVSMLVAAPTYLIWSGWAGVRLLRGRQDLLMAQRSTS